MQYDDLVQKILASAVNRNEIPEGIMAMIKGIAKLTLFYRDKRKDTAEKTAKTIVDLSEAYHRDLHAGE